MLLDGESGGPYHAWQETTPYLKRMLDDTGLFQTDVVTAPPRGGDFTNFKPDWSKYQVIVLNYDAPDERWSADLKASFEKYVRDGGGLVVVHAADNAFPNWREFNLMIGVGGWRGRNEKSGPHFYYKDGKLVADTSPGSAGSHGARLPIQGGEHRDRPPHHEGSAERVDARGRRTLRRDARAGRKHDRAVNGVFGSRQQGHGLR